MVIKYGVFKWSLKMVIRNGHFKCYPHVRDVYMIMSCGEVCISSLPSCETYVALRCRTWCCHGINECSSILAWEPSEAHSLMRGQGHVWQRNGTCTPHPNPFLIWSSIFFLIIWYSAFYCRCHLLVTTLFASSFFTFMSKKRTWNE